MATATKARRRDKAELITSEHFAKVFQAYLECSDEVQKTIEELAMIVNDPEATREEMEAAVSTIAEALFPSRHGGSLGIDLGEAEEIDRGEHEELLAAMDGQEATFGERVAALLEAKGMTQGDLASALGIGQPAVSMMLSRECRPQRRTVEKVATVLGADPKEIWPEM